MAQIKLRGITWDHRRATEPLLGTAALFRVQRPDIEITWTSRPLSGFEFTSVNALAEDFDFIILDHPFMGEVAAAQSLMPLDPPIAGKPEDYAGPSLETYRYQGKLWALPVDAACQVSVSRPDVMARLKHLPPATWDELLALGAAARRQGLFLAIALKGVHSLMTYFTLMANLGAPCPLVPGPPFADRAVAQQSLAIMRELLSFCPPQALDWNSIALHDAMVARDDLAFCPAVYGYATYAEADQRKPLRFHDLPGPKGHAGSTIGGTGLGISAQSRHPEAALSYARFASTPTTQRAFAMHHGQPARHEVWEDAGINARFGNCYRHTRRTIETCWVRPRHAGYLDFQAEGGDLIEAYFRGHLAEAALLDKLTQSYAQSFR